MAGELGVHYAETLTGFKWIANKAMELRASHGWRFVFGFEEALGYSVGELVRDKDGIGAALVFADLAAFCRARGRTVLDYLEEIYRRFDLYVSGQMSVTLPGTEGAGAIARIMEAFEPVLLEDPPRMLIVVGDVNSTLACSLVASKLGVAIAHVEAGLRSFDRSMPEELNRLLTDQLADLLFTSCRGADENLRREGVDAARIRFVGNVMIDSLRASLPRAAGRAPLAALGIEPARYAVATIHRPSNVDDAADLALAPQPALHVEEIGLHARR